MEIISFSPDAAEALASNPLALPPAPPPLEALLRRAVPALGSGSDAAEEVLTALAVAQVDTASAPEKAACRTGGRLRRTAASAEGHRGAAAGGALRLGRLKLQPRPPGGGSGACAAACALLGEVLRARCEATGRPALERVETLDLSGCGLETPHAEHLDGAPAAALDLSFNKLESFSAASLPLLRSLDLSHNRLGVRSLLELELQDDVWEVNLACNGLAGTFSCGGFHPDLQVLSLSRNSISAVVQLEKLPGLLSLDLSLNKLARFGGAGLADLTTLDLSCNGLEVFSGEGLAGLTALPDLSGNRICVESLAALRLQDTDLEILDLSRNLLAGAFSLAGVHLGLRVLDLSRNQLRALVQLPPAAAELERCDQVALAAAHRENYASLERLDLRHNRLSDASAVSELALPPLQELLLEGNPMSAAAAADVEEALLLRRSAAHS